MIVARRRRRRLRRESGTLRAAFERERDQLALRARGRRHAGFRETARPRQRIEPFELLRLLAAARTGRSAEQELIRTRGVALQRGHRIRPRVEALIGERGRVAVVVRSSRRRATTSASSAPSASVTERCRRVVEPQQVVRLSLTAAPHRGSAQQRTEHGQVVLAVIDRAIAGSAGAGHASQAPACCAVSRSNISWFGTAPVSARMMSSA